MDRRRDRQSDDRGVAFGDGRGGRDRPIDVVVGDRPNAGAVLHDEPGRQRTGRTLNVSSELGVDVAVDRDVDDLLGLAGRERQFLRCERGEVDALGCRAARGVDGDLLATDCRDRTTCTVNEAITVSGVSPSVTETSSIDTSGMPSSFWIVPDPEVALQDDPGTRVVERERHLLVGFDRVVTIDGDDRPASSVGR